jgi:hypothetical protein
MAEPRRTTVEMPAPTAWPMIAALGVTLLLAGLVTHVAVSATGALLFFFGAVGWFREVLPVQHEETVEMELVEPIEAVPRAVLRLQVGEMRHRVRYPEHIYPYSSGIRGGLLGGVVMAALACLYGVLAYGSVWYPINLLAATASQNLSTASTAELAAFSGEGLLLGVIIHGVSCILVGLLYAMLLPMFPWHPLLFGGVVAPLVWTGLLWASLRVINPALNARIDWLWFIASQIGFGLAAGFAVSRTQRVGTMQHLPLLVRAGIEAPGVSPPRDGEK